MGIIKKIIKKMKKTGKSILLFNDFDHQKEYKKLKEVNKDSLKKENFTLKLNFISGSNSGMCQEPNKVEVLALYNFKKGE